MMSTALTKKTDMDGPEAIQTTSVYLHLPLRLLPSCGCEAYKLGPSSMKLILSSICRVLTRQQNWYSSARMTNSNSRSSRTPISVSRRQSRPPPGRLFPVMAQTTRIDETEQHARLLVYPKVLENTREKDGTLHLRTNESPAHEDSFSLRSQTLQTHWYHFGG